MLNALIIQISLKYFNKDLFKYMYIYINKYKWRKTHVYGWQFLPKLIYRFNKILNKTH